jgi:CRP/FNR family cyclic AMP-dependent transcriptional regulator
MARVAGPFSRLDEAALRELAPNGTSRVFPARAVILNQGDDTRSFYVLLSGRVKAYLTDEQGRELVVNTIEAGDYFGELVLDGGPRAASVMTLEPCRVYVIPQSDLERLIAAHPEFSRDLVERLIGKVRELTQMVLDLALKDVYSRFLRYVTEHAVDEDGVRIVPERLTQHEIAARIGGSREMVSRIVRDLSEGGYIAVDGKRIRILRKLPPRW